MKLVSSEYYNFKENMYIKKQKDANDVELFPFISSRGRYLWCGGGGAGNILLYIDEWSALRTSPKLSSWY